MRLYTVGRTIAGKPAPVAIKADDALAVALKAKEGAPDAMITYVRKQNKRGDWRHPHQAADDIGWPGQPCEKPARADDGQG